MNLAGIPYVGNRDRDTGRDIICRGWNSDMESMEKGVSDVTEMEVHQQKCPSIASYCKGL